MGELLGGAFWCGEGRLERLTSFSTKVAVGFSLRLQEPLNKMASVPLQTLTAKVKLS
jgi:hypothetical protein